jgi:uncharacterized radical SAM superfamily Fe-S cluster-containing enzyme
MTACCVLIDVTARCDQHCPWCFARAEKSGESDGEPSLEDIEHWYDRLIELGEERPFNIQLSGGEPAVRDDLPEIVALGRAKGFEYIQLNTNGRRLGSDENDGGAVYGNGEYGEVYARRLADAGLTTVFMQFDGMSDIVYEKLRGESLLDVKFRAIENCAKAGLPVTLVPTIVKGVNIFESCGEICKMIDFMLANLDAVKGIHFQPASFFGRFPPPEMSGGDSRSVINPDRVTMFAVMNEIERQTGGRLKKSDLLPITTGHPLCCFCANFLREKDGRLTSIATEAQREGGMACCDEADAVLQTDAPCCCAPAPDPIEIIKRDRDFVLNKWTVGDRDASAKLTIPDEERPGTGAGNVDRNGISLECDAQAQADIRSDAVMSLDEAVGWLRGNMFTISGMAFMDGSNLDAERLKRCRVQYYTEDGRLIPFCSYNTMYRGRA